MISQNAKQSFNQMLERALRAGLLVSPDGPVEIMPVSDVSRFCATQMVILSVSSYFFRMLVMVYFTDDDVTRLHFATLNKVDVATLDARAFVDAVNERGNICCGSVNRDLAQVFPHVGMSTPNIIDKQCAHHLDVLGSSYQRHLDVIVPDGPRFHASLCITEFEDLDFDLQIAEPQGNGELEIF